MKPKKKLTAGIAIAAAIVLGGWYIAGKGKAAIGNIFQLETVEAKYNTITNSVTATGTVEPVVKVEVGTQVSGIISKLYVDFNDVVAKGQLLAEMDKVNLQAELISKEADLASSKTQFEYQEKNYARSLSLHEKQLISGTDFETATFNYQQAKSSYDRARSDMTKVRRNLEYATITSPIDGVVINRAVEEGQTVAAGFSTPKLFTIANDLTQMRVIANVDEADIGGVEEGQTVKFTVDAYPNDVFEGKVTQIRLEATVTSNVVTYEVVTSAPNPSLKLKPGLTANVTIYTLERPHVLTVPTKALRFIPDGKTLGMMNITVTDPKKEASPGKKIVWIKDGNTLLPKEVSIGTSTPGTVEVTEGLREGETIAIDMHSGLDKQAARGGFPMGPGGRR